MSGSDGCHHGNGKYLLVVIVRGLLCLVAYKFLQFVIEGMLNFS